MSQAECCTNINLQKKDCVWLDFDKPSGIQTIEGSECIGNSLDKINTNFSYLSTLGFDFLYNTCTTFWDVMLCYEQQTERDCVYYYPAGCETGFESELPLLSGGLWGQYFENTNERGITIRQGNLEPLPLDDPFFIPFLDFATVPSEHSLIAIGYFKPPTTGNYTFYLNSKNGSAIWFEDLALGWEGRTPFNALLNNSLGSSLVVPLSNETTIRLAADKYYPLRLVYQNKTTNGNLQFSWSGPGISKTTDLTQHFYYRNDLTWTPETSAGNDFRGNLGYPDYLRPDNWSGSSKTSYYKLNKTFLKFATIPIMSDGLVYLDFFLKRDSSVKDDSPQIVVKIFESNTITFPAVYQPTNNILKYTESFSVDECTEWTQFRINILEKVDLGKPIWVEFSRVTTKSPIEGSIGVGDVHFVQMPVNSYAALTGIKQIYNEDCIGNSRITINSNFQTLSTFLNEAFSECCSGTSTRGREYETITVDRPRNIPIDTDVFAIFDTTSMSVPNGQAAAAALTAWHANLPNEIPGYSGNLYIIPYSDESWVNWPKDIYNKTITMTTGAWDSVALSYRPNWSSLPANITKIFLLAFIDESNSGYHISSTFTNEPTNLYKTHYTEFITLYQNLTSTGGFFKGVCYPIVAGTAGTHFIIHGIGAMYGRTLTTTELSLIYTVPATHPLYVDTSILTTTNPYTEAALGQSPSGLIHYQWRGNWNKTSPAANVFGSDSFSNELNSVVLEGEDTNQSCNRP